MIFSLCITGLLLFMSYTILHRTFFTPLSNIPSAHPLAPYTSLWIQWKRYSGADFDAVSRAFREKGPFIRLGPSEIAVRTMDDGVKNIYGFDADNWNKTSFYKSFENYGTQNTFSSLCQGHTAYRKRLNRVYAKPYIQRSPSVRAILSEILIQRVLPIVQACAARRKPIDILPLNLAYGLDVVSAFEFGLARGTNFLEDERAREEWFALYNESHSSRSMFWLTEHPVLVNWCRMLGVPLLPNKFCRAKRMLEAWAMERVNHTERFLVDWQGKNKEESVDDADIPVLYRSLRADLINNEEDQSGNNEALDKTAKPNDTRTLKLASELLDHLVATRDTFDALRHELLSINQPFLFRANQQDPLPTPDSLESLPLLNAVIKESLRLRNTGPSLNPRVTPAGRKSTLGPWTDIPPGTRVGAYAWCIHRDEDVFPDARTWDPYRWLPENDGGTYSEEVRAAQERWFWAFGSGSRRCSGMALALEMIRFAVAAIFTNFKGSVVDEGCSVDDETFVSGDGSEKLWVMFEALQE
ncbi:cytochrome P450 [Aspergillus stella-maris]|uniref:cytochrome P450 n=1 Tax=Aspergillus stella-maris TaxID=1810926 RepID=UPI003CCD52C6